MLSPAGIDLFCPAPSGSIGLANIRRRTLPPSITERCEEEVQLFAGRGRRARMTFRVDGVSEPLVIDATANEIVEVEPVFELVRSWARRAQGA